MDCVGCGCDISKKSSKDRRNFGPGSTGDPELRKLVWSTWTSLLNQQLSLQGLSIDKTTIDLDNPGRMCKVCFTLYGNYQKLITELEDKISVALQKLNYTIKESSADRTRTSGTERTSGSPCSRRYGSPSASKRRCLSSSPIMMAAASPLVTVP